MRYISRDHVASPRRDVEVPRAELGEPLRLGQAALGAAAVRDVLAGAVEPQRRPVRAHRRTAAAVVDPDRPVAAHDPDVERPRRLAGERGLALGDGALAVVLVDELQGVLGASASRSGATPMSRQSSGDQVSSPDSASRCQLPTPAICCASVSCRSLRRSASSARLRSVMSVEMPITATGAPVGVEDRRLVGQVRAPVPAVLDVDRPAGRAAPGGSARPSARP